MNQIIQKSKSKKTQILFCALTLFGFSFSFAEQVTFTGSNPVKTSIQTTESDGSDNFDLSEGVNNQPILDTVEINNAPTGYVITVFSGNEFHLVHQTIPISRVPYSIRYESGVGLTTVGPGANTTIQKSYDGSTFEASEEELDGESSVQVAIFGPQTTGVRRDGVLKISTRPVPSSRLLQGRYSDDVTITISVNQ